MAFDIPWDLINQVQISLREESKISSYNPNDPSLPNLPSIHVSISDLDPSSSYFRCKHCNGRLLRGSESLLCVFCSRQQHTVDNPPEPLKFNSTFGYNWFLESLQLDGSEMVGPSTKRSEINRGQNALPEEFPLSNLLDFEINWLPVEEKYPTGVSDEESDQMKSSMSFVGVNLENLQWEDKPNEGIANITCQGDLDLFENFGGVGGTGSSDFHHDVLNNKKDDQ